MSQSSLKFGTSGLRGLAVELRGQAARRYTAAFLRHTRQSSKAPIHQVYLGRDFRPSSRDIVQDCAAAVAAAGLVPVDCGSLPTPALALHAKANGGAAIMVTGSHIPADRNGLKFYGPDGEISKADEAGILAALNQETISDLDVDPVDQSEQATERYFERFASVLQANALSGLRIGVFEHSSVARDILGNVLRHFGAEAVSLGRCKGFVPVDTEAFGDAVFAPIAGWVREYGLDAVVSADGDGDRPLLVDETGQFIRGDVLGLLAARHLEAQSVVTPVTSNSAIEALGLFEHVHRTRVGSPFVVGAINGAAGSVIGFEANGGTFVGPGVVANGKALEPLVTRDAVLPILCVLGECVRLGLSLSAIVASLPLKHALADRLQDVASERSRRFLARLRDDVEAARLFGSLGISRRVEIDGLQFWTEAGDMVHFRASGNAPELRCYVEARSPKAARDLLTWGMQTAARETAG